MATDYRKKIGARIAELRKQKGWSQAELAEKVGISRQHINRVENGQYSTGIDIISRITDALGCNLEINPKTLMK